MVNSKIGFFSMPADVNEYTQGRLDKKYCKKKPNPKTWFLCLIIFRLLLNYFLRIIQVASCKFKNIHS
jgi:hypothetical protein